MDNDKPHLEVEVLGWVDLCYKLVLKNRMATKTTCNNFSNTRGRKAFSAVQSMWFIVMNLLIFICSRTHFVSEWENKAATQRHTHKKEEMKLGNRIFLYDPHQRWLQVGLHPAHLTAVLASYSALLFAAS